MDIRKLIKYGSYYGYGHTAYPNEPIDMLDLVTYCHDISYSPMYGSKVMADRYLYRQLKLINYKDLSLKGKIHYIMAKYIFAGLYAHGIRSIIKPPSKERIKLWNDTKAMRDKEIIDYCIWDKYINLIYSII